MQHEIQQCGNCANFRKTLERVNCNMGRCEAQHVPEYPGPVVEGFVRFDEWCCYWQQRRLSGSATATTAQHGGKKQ